MKEKARPEWKVYLYVFGLSMIISVVMFLPYIIMDKGLFIYYGDFNVQQIPFYKLAQESIRNGAMGWNWLTDLGANFVGSYSFYLLGSPYFWITTLFPTDFVPYLLAPLMMLKLSTAAVTGYAFIRRFTKTRQFAILGGLLYAFSGFNIYNIFFNHFLEVAAFFPLMLIALEEFVINRRRGVFALSVSLLCLVNYYFFVAEVIFVLIYFLVRLTSKEFRDCITVKTFLLLLFEAVIGFCGSMILTLPSVLTLLGNYRINQYLSGYNLVVYDQVQRYGHILESLFFPPDMPAKLSFFPNSGSKWGSVAAYLPLVSLSGVILYLRSKKARWIKRLLLISFVMMMIPALNQLFQLENSMYYARWFFMPILIMALASAMALEDTSLNYGYAFRITGVIMLTFACIGILPKIEDDKLVWFSLPDMPERFWSFVVFALAGIFITWILWKLYRQDKTYGRKLLAAVCVFTTIYSCMLLGLGKGSPVEVHNIADLGINGEQNISLPDDGFYRIDLNEAAVDNYGMFWHLPSIRTFHSIVPSSITQFYQSIGLERGVASRPDVSRYALRSLTSTKFLFVNEEKSTPDLVGYNYYGTQNGFKIYENENFIPMGFTYDYYVTPAEFGKCDNTMRDLLMLKGLYLSNEQIEKYGSLMTELPSDEITNLDNSQLASVSAERSLECSKAFDYDNKGFTATITTGKPNLVFFSVPYEEGWSATVNGKAVDVEKVNVGFMAVKVPAGDSTIRFDFKTPGLETGAFVSAGAGLIILAYCLIIFFYRKKHPEARLLKHRHYLLTESDSEEMSLEKDYVSYLTHQSAAQMRSADGKDEKPE